jgi:hypothetical protein
MTLKYLIAAGILVVLGVLLPSFTRGKPNTTFMVFFLRKPLPMLCYGIAVGLVGAAVIGFLKS